MNARYFFLQNQMNERHFSQKVVFLTGAVSTVNARYNGFSFVQMHRLNVILLCWRLDMHS
jgi:hypothetical protein